MHADVRCHATAYPNFIDPVAVPDLIWPREVNTPKTLSLRHVHFARFLPHLAVSSELSYQPIAAELPHDDTWDPWRYGAVPSTRLRSRRVLSSVRGTLGRETVVGGRTFAEFRELLFGLTSEDGQCCVFYNSLVEA